MKAVGFVVVSFRMTTAVAATVATSWPCRTQICGIVCTREATSKAAVQTRFRCGISSLLYLVRITVSGTSLVQPPSALCRIWSADVGGAVFSRGSSMFVGVGLVCDHCPSYSGTAQVQRRWHQSWKCREKGCWISFWGRAEDERTHTKTVGRNRQDSFSFFRFFLFFTFLSPKRSPEATHEGR